MPRRLTDGMSTGTTASGASTMARQVTWTSWPSPGARYRFDSPRMRLAGRRLRDVLTVLVLVVAVVKLPGGAHPAGHRVALGGLGLAVAAAGHAARRAAFRRDAAGLAGCLAFLAASAAACELLGSEFLALAVLCVPVVWLMHLAPAGLAVAYAAAACCAVSAAGGGGLWEPVSVLALNCVLGGYLSRQDREARACTRRLLEQERAARAAERAAHAAQAESAALAERARIARDMHDVLAHSLSAQLVHLEAARLLLDRPGPEGSRELVRERVVTARRMAEEGMAEARRALSALRGEAVPVAGLVRELAEEQGARFRAEGTPRPLGEECAQTVRRVAQEALTNARKHAPAHDVTVRLVYAPGSVLLEVCDRPSPERAGEASCARSAAVEGLAGAGSGLGLLGMRERAALLGGSLHAGPAGEGFRVVLDVPA
ncbi:sensor histidine kinase [Streptosporangium nondiastaticum]|nr:histidine kinase [Streptosporangium nondiastaticum]